MNTPYAIMDIVPLSVATLLGTTMITFTSLGFSSLRRSPFLEYEMMNNIFSNLGIGWPLGIILAWISHYFVGLLMVLFLAMLHLCQHVPLQLSAAVFIGIVLGILNILVWKCLMVIFQLKVKLPFYYYLPQFLVNPLLFTLITFFIFRTYALHYS
ncbi:hypothetical protein ACG2LH_18070 [Zhouia sp. PK063]|uniref:hypothetical protein n=1 Tax=Zhouia sp. PK063 TaxID=3373602 RepID=UPI0037B10C17